MIEHDRVTASQWKIEFDHFYVRKSIVQKCPDEMIFNKHKKSFKNLKELSFTS